MFGLESNTRYFMCQHPVSMRKGIDSLFNLVVSESPMSAMTGGRVRILFEEPAVREAPEVGY